MRLLEGDELRFVLFGQACGYQAEHGEIQHGLFNLCFEHAFSGKLISCYQVHLRFIKYK
jgi:hypothetical protein